MEELKRFQVFTFDEFSRRRLIEDRDTILEFTAKIQEPQNEVNRLNDSRDLDKLRAYMKGTLASILRPFVYWAIFERCWQITSVGKKQELDNSPTSIWCCIKDRLVWIYPGPVSLSSLALERRWLVQAPQRLCWISPPLPPRTEHWSSFSHPYFQEWAHSISRSTLPSRWPHRWCCFGQTSNFKRCCPGLGRTDQGPLVSLRRFHEWCSQRHRFLLNNERVATSTDGSKIIRITAAAWRWPYLLDKVTESTCLDQLRPWIRQAIWHTGAKCPSFLGGGAFLDMAGHETGLRFRPLLAKLCVLVCTDSALHNADADTDRRGSDDEWLAKAKHKGIRVFFQHDVLVCVVAQDDVEANHLVYVWSRSENMSRCSWPCGIPASNLVPNRDRRRSAPWRMEGEAWLQIGKARSEQFRVTGTDDSVENYTDLFNVSQRNDDIQEFDSKWDGILLSMTKIPPDDILEGLYKLRIRESEKLKTVLELYNMEIHQKKAGLDYQRLKTMVKRSIEQNLRIKNFGSRNGNSETNALVKNQGTKQREQRSLGDCWQRKANGQCSKGDNFSFRHDMNQRSNSTQPNPSPRSSTLQNEGNASRTKCPRGKSPSGRMFRLPCKDYFKGTCTNSSCEKWQPPECLLEKVKLARKRTCHRPMSRSIVETWEEEW